MSARKGRDMPESEQSDSPSYKMVPVLAFRTICCCNLQLCRILRHIVLRRYKHEVVMVKSQVFGFAFVLRRRDT